MKVTASPSHRLTLRADPGALTRLGDWVGGLAVELGVGDRDRFRLDLALTEAITNIITHGYPPDGCNGEIAIHAETDGRVLRITITDQGAAFDPLGAPLPDQPARLEDATPGGLGLALIRGYCDDCHYERTDHQNRLTFVFRLKPSPSGQT